MQGLRWGRLVSRTAHATGVALALYSGVIAAQARPDDCTAIAAGGPACGDDSAGSYTPKTRDTRFVANPVDVIAGAKYEQRTDWRAFGSRLGFSRHYNSTRAEADRGLGGGWRHDHDLTLGRLPTGDGLRLVQSDGRVIDFLRVDASLPVWQSRGQADGFIELVDRRYVWRVPDGRSVHFPGARPELIVWPDGDELTLQWHEGRLASIADVQGRRIELVWSPGRSPLLRGYDPVVEMTLPGHLARVHLPDGSELSFRYDNRHRLRTVRRDGVLLERLGYDDEHEAALASVEDEEGTRHWEYDGEGRVDRFVERDGRALSFAYRRLPAGQDVERGITDVRREDDARVEYTWEASANGAAQLLRVIEYPCPDCAGAPRDITPSTKNSAGQDSEPAPGEIVEGLRVERLGESDADLLIESSGARLTVRFDRRARVRDLTSLDSDSPAITDVERVQELENLRRLLDSGVFVDPSGTVYRKRSSTTSVCPLPIFRTCDELYHDMQLAQISICAYAQGACAVVGWRTESPGDLGLNPSDFDDGNFHAVAYRNLSSGELVVAFRGTYVLGDFVADLNQIGGHDSRTYRNAVELAEELDREQIDVTYTGHSLGGGLATAAALASGEQAVGFNSAALTVDSADRLGLDLADADQQVTHLLVPGEPVTILQETPMRDPSSYGHDDDYDREIAPWVTHPAPGRRDVLAAPAQADIDRARAEISWLARALVSRDVEVSLAAHLMTSVVSSLHATISARCSHLPPSTL